MYRKVNIEIIIFFWIRGYDLLGFIMSFDI